MENKYLLVNRSTGATIVSNKAYLAEWLSRGFEIDGVEVDSSCTYSPEQDTNPIGELSPR